MPEWGRKALKIAAQVILIWAVILALTVIFTLAGLDPRHRPLSLQLRQMFWPSLLFAVAIRIFKYNRLVQAFRKDD